MTFEEQFIDVLTKVGIDVLLTNPCARIKELLKLIKNRSEFDVINLPREDHGIGISCGAFLAGKRPALLIQSTGIGNLLNSLASLTLTYHFPLPIFCSWRGVIDEPVEAQKQFGEALEDILKSLKVHVHKIVSQGEISIIETETSKAFSDRSVHVFLISPRLWSKEVLMEIDYPPRNHKKLELKQNNQSLKNIHLTRYEVIREIAHAISDDVALISNIGMPSKELFDIKDRNGNFYMTGSLGQVSAIGLGLSRYTEKQIIVLDGDGSLLMNPGILPLISNYSRNNLTIICLDNGTFGSTGDQITLSWDGLDLVQVANSFGLTKTRTIYLTSEIIDILKNIEKIEFINVKIKVGNADVKPISLSNREIADRFSNWVQE